MVKFYYKNASSDLDELGWGPEVKPITILKSVPSGFPPLMHPEPLSEDILTGLANETVYSKASPSDRILFEEFITNLQRNSINYLQQSYWEFGLNMWQLPNDDSVNILDSVLSVGADNRVAYIGVDVDQQYAVLGQVAPAQVNQMVVYFTDSTQKHNYSVGIIIRKSSNVYSISAYQKTGASFKEDPKAEVKEIPFENCMCKGFTLTKKGQLPMAIRTTIAKYLNNNTV